MTDLLRIDGLAVSYGRVPALRGVDLSVPARGAVAVLGANGAGKTTLLRTISGVLKPGAGTIRLDGAPIQARSPSDIVALGIAQVPEGRRVFAELSVADNLEMGAFVRAGAAHRAARERMHRHVLELFPRLAERRAQAAGSLSGGEQQMLAIGRALMSLPRLLMLDEPSLGLAPLVVSAIYDALGQLLADGIALLLVEQSVPFAARLAGHAIVLAQGAVVGAGRPDQLAEGNLVERAYLGGGAQLPS